MQVFIEKLRDLKSIVVVGGQQVGFLMGFFYIIYKIIFIIVFVRQQEEVLQIFVVLIFWVVGEDYDLEEINYVYMLIEKKGLVKQKFLQFYWKKILVVKILFDQEKCVVWIEEVFAVFEEMDYINVFF